MNSRPALITFLDGGGAGPDNSLPGGGGNYPSHGLPPGAVQLPVFPFDPTVPPSVDNTLPGSGGRPDNSLPNAPAQPDNALPGGGHVSGQPIVPGRKFVVKWLACTGLILVPDQGLPENPTPTPKQGQF